MEIDFDLVHLAGIKHQTHESLCRLRTKGEDKTLLIDELPVLSIPQLSFEFAQQSELIIYESNETPKGPFVPFTHKFCMLADIKNKNKMQILMEDNFFSIVHRSGLPICILLFWKSEHSFYSR